MPCACFCSFVVKLINMQSTVSIMTCWLDVLVSVVHDMSVVMFSNNSKHISYLHCGRDGSGVLLTEMKKMCWLLSVKADLSWSYLPKIPSLLMITFQEYASLACTVITKTDNSAKLSFWFLIIGNLQVIVMQWHFTRRPCKHCNLFILWLAKAFQ